MDEELRESCRTLEKCLFHKGRIVTPSFISENNMLPFFQIVGLEPFLTLNEPICPRFVVEFYHNLKVKRDEELRPYIEFKLGQFTFKLTLSQLSQILKTPHVLETFYTTEWLLNSLDDHPKRNYFGLKHDLIKKAITTPRTTQAQLLRDPNKLYVDDIHPDLKGWELFFKENFFCSTNKRNKGAYGWHPLLLSLSERDVTESYRTLEKSLFHEGRIVTPSFIFENNMLPFFQVVGLELFLTLNEPICPRFVVDLYHSLEVKRDEELRPYNEFKLGQFTFKLTLSRLS
ncbi:hypothetical protein Tco_0680540 [Tanacetum coccineum]|uniref:Uncharacterized protein n=1 Tax=Tanacetum coccineum TaxID=301880 RepID=A0ABQ4XLR6_9ASTR